MCAVRVEMEGTTTANAMIDRPCMHSCATGLPGGTARDGREGQRDGGREGGRTERDRTGKDRPPRARRDRTHLADGQPRGLHNAQSTSHGKHDHAGHTEPAGCRRRAAAFQQHRRISHTGCWRPMGWWGDRGGGRGALEGVLHEAASPALRAPAARQPDVRPWPGVDFSGPSGPSQCANMAHVRRGGMRGRDGESCGTI